VWTATDGSGNTSTCLFHVTVVDEEAPVISCHDNQTRSTTPGLCSYTVAGTEFDPLTVSDNCLVQSLVNDYNGGSTLAGAEMPLGTTAITWTVTDGYGNTASCAFTVTVNDDEAPTVTCVGNQSRNADETICFYTVQGTEFDPTSSDDNCSVAGLVNDFNNTATLDGAEIPLGTTTIVWTITDATGNSSSCSFDVSVNDNQYPYITCPDDIAVTTDAGQCDAYVTVPVPDYGDNCTETTLTNDYTGTGNASGTYPKGITVVTFTVTDGYGNTTTCSINVTVTDDEAPVVTCPADIPDAPVDEGLCTATLTPGTATVTDNCPAGVTVGGVRSDGLALNAPYPVGLTTITWTGSDQSGNTDVCEQSITVIDNEAPTVTCPPDQNNVATVTGECSAIVDPGVPTAHDNCTSPVTDITGLRDDGLALTEPYPAGVTVITWTVRDAGGNSATCTQTITVKDKEAPVIACPDMTLQVTQPGECSMYVTIPVPEPTDNCGVESFTNDMTGTENASAIYSFGTTTVTYTVEDFNGNASTCNFTVHVESPLLAVVDSTWTVQGIPVEIDVLANDLACENNIDKSTLTMNVAPQNGTYSISTANGTINYVPDIDFSGWEIFSYNICDTHGYCSTGDVVVFVDLTNHRGSAMDDYDTTFMNRPLTFFPMANDFDPDPGDSLKITSICQEPSHGTIVINPDWSITYTPDMDYIGPDQFCYEICDDGYPVLCDTAMVYIMVLELNDPNVYNILTPNGDGINDVLIIGDIYQYPENELYIYNRWGDEMAKFKNYNNTTVVWDCRRTKDNKIVPSGVYYYILRVSHPDKIYKGWIYVMGSD
jgi:gliding motility-associated-like protein